MVASSQEMNQREKGGDSEMQTWIARCDLLDASDADARTTTVSSFFKRDSESGVIFFSFQVLDGKEPLATIKEAKSVLFTHESGKSGVIRRLHPLLIPSC